MGEWDSLIGIPGLVLDGLSCHGQRVLDLMHCTIGAGAIMAGGYCCKANFKCMR